MGKLRSIEELFAGRHFDREVIILCVRWYLRYKLSFRDLVEMMSERGLQLVHTTILRWVQRYAREFMKRWDRFGRSIGRSWRVDETYIKIRGEMDLPLSRSGQGRADCRLQAQQDTRCSRSKGLLQEGDPA